MDTYKDEHRKLILNTDSSYKDFNKENENEDEVSNNNLELSSRQLKF
jgi:hypothetical protein